MSEIGTAPPKGRLPTPLGKKKEGLLRDGKRKNKTETQARGVE